MKIELSDRRRRHVTGVLLLALGLVAVASLATYRPPSLGFGAWSMANASGPLGAMLAHGLFGAFGRVAAWGVPLLLFAWSLNRLRGRPVAPLAMESAFATLLVLEALALAGLFGARALAWSGSFGAGVAGVAHGILGPIGGGVALSALFLVTGLVASEIGFGLVTQLWRVFVKAPARAVLAGARERHAAMRAARDSVDAPPDSAEVAAASTALAPPRARSRRPAGAVDATAPAGTAAGVENAVPIAPRIVAARPVTEGDALARARREEAEARARRNEEKEQKALARAGRAIDPALAAAPGPVTAGELPFAGTAAAAAAAAAEAVEAAAEAGAPRPGVDPDAPLTAGMAGMSGVATAAQAMGAKGSAVVRTPEIPRVPYVPGDLPELDLLEDPPTGIEGPAEEELTAEAQLLTTRMLDFGITGRVTEIHPGPVVTMFEFEPAAGVKVSQITSREDDLALAMRARQIRIMAPIPGKAAVGIEIPNRKPRTVYLKEVLGSDVYRADKGALKIVLGVDAGGNSFGYDITKMPHVLVAGATGAGKSVYLNVLVTSLLYGHGPDTLRFVMIDPKMLELTGYNGIPHLLMPVVTDAKRASRALRWTVGEMERRYKLLAGTGARNIEGFNGKLAGPNPPTSPEGERLEPLAYIVVLVDELADLMLTAPVEIEEPIARLAQMARAVGIHLVLATQRPSVDVLTGVIKANFPSRIAFQVASKVDSRTILDMNGAEALLGHGDMLFLPAGKPEPYRVHAPWLSEPEASRVADYWRARAPKTPPLSIEDQIEAEAEGVDGDDDELVPEAVRLVITHQQGSTSLLQRRLKVGYSRASRLMDKLEAMGIVGPFMGSKARDVLVDETQLEEYERH
jgi:DNA segregation ATPase FtsK/SpoIIIE-like protein